MASSVPGAVAYLTALCQSVLPTNSLVWFGQELPKFTAPITLQITGVQGDQTPAELGPSFRREETYSILCDLTSYAGDTDFASRMTEVYTNFELITIAIGNDATLGQNVRYAEVGDFEFTPVSDMAGQSIGNLTFSVRCSQRITSLT